VNSTRSPTSRSVETAYRVGLDRLHRSSPIEKEGNQRRLRALVVKHSVAPFAVSASPHMVDARAPTYSDLRADEPARDDWFGGFGLLIGKCVVVSVSPKAALAILLYMFGPHHDATRL
jgi:hypothetical protein